MLYVSFIDQFGQQTRKHVLPFDDINEAKRALTTRKNNGMTITILDENGYPIAITEYRYKKWKGWKHFK